MNYETFAPLRPRGSYIGFDSLGAPSGASVGQQLAELLRGIASQLNLPDRGVVTPWAKRVGDMDWQEIERPDTNVATFEITEERLLSATEALFGQPLPFLTVMTGELQPVAELNRILEGSRYELYETQGVYRQDDADPMPRILYLHWLSVKDLAEQPTRNVKPMEQVAKEMHGLLRYSQQVEVEGSTQRGVPGISFEDAFKMQEPTPIVLPPEAVVPTPVSVQPIPSDSVLLPTPGFPVAVVRPPPVSKPSAVGPVLLCAGVFTAIILAGRLLKK